MANKSEDVRVEPITNPADFKQAFHCVSEAFGRQTADAIWITINPTWDSPQGQERGAAQLVSHFNNITLNRNGDPNLIYLKGTVPDPSNPNERIIAGFASWQQCSFADGYGNPPSADLGDDIADLSPKEQRLATQFFSSMYKRRIEIAKEKATASPPHNAIFTLDLCAVDPAFQRRGIASKLVQWGLDEAKRRGGLEATTEASSMGRSVYMRLGMRPEGTEDIPYEIDEEFKDRETPANVFLRTGVTG